MKRSRLRAIAAIAVFISSTAAVGTASAAVVSGSIDDRKGDGVSPYGVHPYDLESLAVRYDDAAGGLTMSFDFHDARASGDWFTYQVSARIGVWRPALRTCDTRSNGALAISLRPNFDAPVPNDWVAYSVMGYLGGAEQLLQVFYPEGHHFVGDTEYFTFADAPALAGRGYTCVTDVALTNGAGGRDYADKPFCMSPSGTVACSKTRTR